MADVDTLAEWMDEAEGDPEEMAELEELSDALRDERAENGQLAEFHEASRRRADAAIAAAVDASAAAASWRVKE